jgi:ADP-ribose pyrophosphatase
MIVNQVTSVYQSRFLNMIEANYTDKTGNEKKWVYAQRPKNTGVVFVAAIVNQVPFGAKTFQGIPNLVVIKEFRVSIQDYVYSIPAGLVDPGETIEEAVDRELKEETGLTIKSIQLITPPLYSSPGITDEAAAIVYATAEGNISSNQLEASEDLTAFFATKEQVRELINDRNNYFDAKAYLIFQQFATFGYLV